MIGPEEFEHRCECRRDQAEENDRPKHEANRGRVDLPNQRSS